MSEWLQTTNGMLTLLHSWLYAAEANDLQASRPDYADALRQALNAVEVSTHPAEAVVLPRALDAVTINRTS